MLYRNFFRAATGNDPYPYQERLAQAVPTTLSVPTGLGKTEAVILGWLYRGLFGADGAPRRMFYVLPMRSLVEQTVDRVGRILDRLKAHPDLADLELPPKPEMVMGGFVGENWFRHPERRYIVIGTQDLMLSRALNRGYAMNRFLWPMAFGASHSDCAWVLDEVQLQGIGAVTAAQLHAFAEQYGVFGKRELTLLSATIDEEWFETGDFSLKNRPRLTLDDDDRENERVQGRCFARKRISCAAASDPRAVADLALERHRPATRTLVIVNRVERAQEIYAILCKRAGDVPVTLLHSRFRSGDRARHMEKLLEQPNGAGRIIVATQVVEAGVDISSSTLITDLAPWSSIVQRLGRCNRSGDEVDAECIWLDLRDEKAATAPYLPEDLAPARAALRDCEGRWVTPGELPHHPIPLRSGLVLRTPDFLDLFDTSLDLAGHDVDVAPYIRPDNDRSVYVFWRADPPLPSSPPQGSELCRIPVEKMRELLESLHKVGHGNDAMRLNTFAGKDRKQWERLSRDELRPGLTIWLKNDVGWYDPDVGFAKSYGTVEPATETVNDVIAEGCATDDDALTNIGVPVSLADHSLDTRAEATSLASDLGLEPYFAEVAAKAALWHDVGKAHECFQEMLLRGNAGVTDAAMTIWAKSKNQGVSNNRSGFRHELPGALVYLEYHPVSLEADLVAYLIASHHGKMRMSVTPLPSDIAEPVTSLLGNRDGDVVAGCVLSPGNEWPPTRISLESFSVGSTLDTPLWIDRTSRLRDDVRHGPFRMAYLELVVRLADWRASEKAKKAVSK